MTAKKFLPPVPPALYDVALIDGPTAAAAGAESLSAFLERVSTGDAPQPVIRQPRYTRWLLADVRADLIRRVAQADANVAARVTAHATKASAEARKPAAVAKAKATRAAKKAAATGAA